MTVRADGADVEFDCGMAVISAPITLDEKGTFDVTGKFTAEGPGPSREDAPTQPVQFRGALKSDELTVIVAFPGDKSEFGTFTVKLGQRARLLKCR